MVTMRNDEDREQRALFAVLDRFADEYPALAFVFHVPNGGARDVVTGARLKAAGVRRGVPDIICPAASWQCQPLAIEMKAAGGRLSRYQAAFRVALEQAGWVYTVCYSAGSAALAIVNHMALPIDQSVLKNAVLMAGGTWDD